MNTNTLAAGLVGFLLGGLTVSVAAELEDDTNDPRPAMARAATRPSRLDLRERLRLRRVLQPTQDRPLQSVEGQRNQPLRRLLTLSRRAADRAPRHSLSSSAATSVAPGLFRRLGDQRDEHATNFVQCVVCRRSRVHIAVSSSVP